MMKGLLLGCSVAIAACSTDSIVETGTGLPENRGTEIAPGVTVERLTELAWSADGSEVYFQSAESGGARLYAVSRNGGTPRLLDGPRDGYVDITPSPDGAWLYFATNLRTGVRTLYRLSLAGGPAQVLADRSPGRIALTRADGSLVLPAPNGLTVAFVVAPDSVFTLTLATGQRNFITTGCERLVAQSPDLRTLLCVTAPGGSGAYMFLDLLQKTTTLTTVLPPSEGVPQMIHWDAGGISVAYQTVVGLNIWNVQRATTTLAFTFPPRSGLLLDRRNSAWSRDGQRIAFWIHECLRRRGFSQCDEGQSILYILELAALKSGTVAVARGEEGGQFMALSANAASVVYTFGGRVYHQSTAIP